MARKRNEAETAEENRRRTLLEQTLSYVLPREDARQVCARMLEAFGTFDGVFAAPEQVVADLPGAGPETARFLKLVVELSQAYLEERSWSLQRVYDTASAVEMFRPKFLGRKNETVCLMMLDGRGRVIYNDLISEGALSHVPLYLRKVIHLCLEYRTETVFLAHNHPSGVALPSYGDMLVTDRLMTALNSIDATLSDHIIFAGDSYYSFLESGMLDKQEKLMQAAQAREIEDVRLLEERMRQG